MAFYVSVSADLLPFGLGSISPQLPSHRRWSPAPPHGRFPLITPGSQRSPQGQQGDMYQPAPTRCTPGVAVFRASPSLIFNNLAAACKQCVRRDSILREHLHPAPSPCLLLTPTWAARSQNCWERLSLWLSVGCRGLGSRGRLQGWEHWFVCVLCVHGAAEALVVFLKYCLCLLRV